MRNWNVEDDWMSLAGFVYFYPTYEELKLYLDKLEDGKEY